MGDENQWVQDVCGKYGATLACIHPDDSIALAYKFNIGYLCELLITVSRPWQKTNFMNWHQIHKNK